MIGWYVHESLHLKRNIHGPTAGVQALDTKMAIVKMYLIL